MNSKKIEVLEDSCLKNLKTVRHGFFTRFGGVSKGVHASLNCAYVSDDCEKNVQENRRRVAHHLGYRLEALASVKNIHSHQVVVLEDIWLEGNKPIADAVVTNKPHVVLGSDSADCPIILFADAHAKVIGLAHAGWKGAISGIIESTVEKMVVLGAHPHQMVAAISPCIAQCSYEVGNEFYLRFLEHDPCNRQYFKDAIKHDHFLFDLLSFVKGRLSQMNIQTISSEIAFDTFSDHRFFSCRRAFKNGDTSFGGHFSCIVMEE